MNFEKALATFNVILHQDSNCFESSLVLSQFLVGSRLMTKCMANNIKVFESSIACFKLGFDSLEKPFRLRSMRIRGGSDFIRLTTVTRISNKFLDTARNIKIKCLFVPLIF